MWLHEGQIAAIKNYPELAFTAQWQLFDIAVSNRNEGYTVCLDGETVTTEDSLRRLNNKGLVERDHIHKKDTFYLYKAHWSSEPFIHICQKNYKKYEDRVIYCYTNIMTTNMPMPQLYVNDTYVCDASIWTIYNCKVVFPPINVNAGDEVKVKCNQIYVDSFIVE